MAWSAWGMPEADSEMERWRRAALGEETTTAPERQPPPPPVHTQGGPGTVYADGRRYGEFYPPRDDSIPFDPVTSGGHVQAPPGYYPPMYADESGGWGGTFQYNGPSVSAYRESAPPAPYAPSGPYAPPSRTEPSPTYGAGPSDFYQDDMQPTRVPATWGANVVRPAPQRPALYYDPLSSAYVPQRPALYYDPLSSAYVPQRPSWWGAPPEPQSWYLYLPETGTRSWQGWEMGVR